MKRHLGLLALLTLSFAPIALADPSGLAFPQAYRSWAHAKSMVIPDPAHPLAGFHHVYVQPEVVADYRAGKVLPNGAQLAVAFYEVVDQGGTTNQGALKMVAVMKKDPAAKATGGWRYGAFDAAGKALAIDVVTGCYNCHAAQKARDYLFSTWQ